MDFDEENMVMNVEFEGRTPVDSDYDGIHTLLRQLFLMSNIDLLEMTTQIISQNYVGSVLHQIDTDESDDESDDDDNETPVFGFLTVINITEKSDLEFVKSLKEYILSYAKNYKPIVVEELEKVFNDEKQQVGFIINERILSSAELACRNFEVLWKDLEKASKKNMKYKFDKYLILTRSSCTQRQAEEWTKKNFNKKDISKLAKEFVNPEDRLFYENSSIFFDYSVSNQHDTLVEMNSGESLEHREPLRTVILVEADKVTDIMTLMKSI